MNLFFTYFYDNVIMYWGDRWRIAIVVRLCIRISTREDGVQAGRRYWITCLHTTASVTNQYNLVKAIKDTKVNWCTGIMASPGTLSSIRLTLHLHQAEGWGGRSTVFYINIMPPLIDIVVIGNGLLGLLWKVTCERKLLSYNQTSNIPHRVLYN